MKVRYNAGNVEFEFEASSQAQVFETLSKLDGFADEPCGACGCEEVTHEAYKGQKGTFFAIKCKSCGAKLDIAQRKSDGGLFKSRTGQNGEPKGDPSAKGWSIYRPRNDGYSQPAGNDGFSGDQASPPPDGENPF